AREHGQHDPDLVLGGEHRRTTHLMISLGSGPTNPCAKNSDARQHRRDRPALRTLADHLHTWLRPHLATLADATPAMPVEDRAADTWEPLVAVADHAGGTWPARARTAVTVITAEATDTGQTSLRIRLLADCRTAFTGHTALSTGYLLDRLNADPEAPWPDLGPTGLTARRLADLLREYDIRSGNIRFPDGTQTKGYLAADFTDAWARYCPVDNPPAGGGVPTVPPVPAQVSPGRIEPVGRINRPSTPDAGPPAICIACRAPLDTDDGSHTHPACTVGNTHTG
ncbi:DUF3631 domain-containing protein, partial [Protofrankia symbiont of Coriaria myrtifolia]|uniref:DUF3631 domain-containing protein n=1 Tax=Protofrankia symbiont of Coriaria myrtifolia TaxID=1306540 RepID=UPI001F5E9524